MDKKFEQITSACPEAEPAQGKELAIPIGGIHRAPLSLNSWGYLRLSRAVYARRMGLLRYIQQSRDRMVLKDR